MGKNGKFVIPGVVAIKTRQKKATKAGKRENFGKMVMVKAKPAKTIVKAFPAKALKEAPRVLLHFLLLLLVHPSLRGIFVSFCPGWPEGAWSCMAFSSARTLGEGDHMYSTSVSQA